MSWLGGDSFDFYEAGFSGAGVNTEQWASISQSTVFVTTGRFGNQTNVLQLGNNSVTPGAATSALFANSSTIYVNFQVLNNAANGLVGFRLLDGGVDQVGVYCRNDGLVVITTGETNATLVAVSGAVLPPSNTWFHCQAKVVIHNTLGSVEIRINGNTAADYLVSNINTRNGTGAARCNQVMFRSNAAAGLYVDDVYWFNDQGAQPNTWQGDIHAVQQLPASDASIQWSRNGGASNFSRVNQANTAQDGDATYVFDTVVGHVDQYGLAPLPVTPAQIVCVQSKMNYRMDDAGPHQVKLRLHSGVVDADGPVKVCGSAYNWTQSTYTTDPNTGLGWTTPAVNALTVGPVNVL